MISFNSDMQTEKLAAFGLAIIILGGLAAFVVIEYGDELFNNLQGKEKAVIELGDCADIDFNGYFSNGTYFATSYEDIAIQSGLYNELVEYKPLQVFVTMQWDEKAPGEKADTYSMIPVDGFMENIIGLKEGQAKTIGPIPPEKGFGILLQVDDIVDVTVDPTFGIPNMNVKFVDIIENAVVAEYNIPADFLYFVASENTTIYTGKDLSKSLGDTKTLYTSWPDATVATKVTDDQIWWETNPSEEDMINFTWIEEDPVYGFSNNYWENASNAVINETNNEIVITHSPQMGQNMTYFFVEYSVEEITADKINCSYTDNDGNTSYQEFDRIINISYNASEDLVIYYPEEYLTLLLASYRQIDPDMNYGVGPMAGEDIFFDVNIKAVYKTSQES